MRHIAPVLVIIGLVSQSKADVTIATSQGLSPGVYQAPGYTTRFDGEGKWATSSTLGTSPLIEGRYTIADEIIAFTSTPPGCAQERVRYRVVARDPQGFRLHFLEDTCGRSKQMADIVFVRVQK